MNDNRPSPEEILSKIKADEPKDKGKLKIFFGACAGVGKTFAMLLAAKNKINDNVGVLIGVVETHGRIETIKLLEGIPVLSLKKQMRQNIELFEFDLDEALNRNPDIILIDELAHSNLPGSRHPKRWQDVLELLDHGIDVYTTLNVQHLESLNDVVSHITGIKVRETIPDRIFDKSDEVVLVDIPSEIILERLNEGKVYLGEFLKKQAAQNFFRIENLVALREMALRRVAEQVEAKKDLYVHFDEKEKKVSMYNLLVCIGPGKKAEKLIRIAKQYAARNKVSWTVLYVESKEHYYLQKNEIAIIEKNIYQAQLLGATTMVIPSLNIAEAIIRFSKEKGFGTILIGKSHRYLCRSMFSNNILKEILENKDPIDIYVLNLKKQDVLNKNKNLPKVQSYFKASFILLSVTVLSYTLISILNLENVIMLYLMAIIYIALTTETAIAFLSVFVSLFIYNYIFVYPYYNIDILKYLNTSTGLTSFIFVFTTLLVGVQTNKLRIQNQLINKRAKYNAELQAFTQKLLIAHDQDRVVKITVEHIGNLLNVIVIIWLEADSGHLQLRSHQEKLMDPKEESAAIWCFENNNEAGKGSDTIPSARGSYWPLNIGNRAIGTLGIITKDQDRELDQEEKNELRALMTQATLAFDRVKNFEKSDIFSSEYDD